MFCQSLRVDVAQFEFFAALYPPFGMFRQPQIVFSNSEHHFPRYGVLCASSARSRQSFGLSSSGIMPLLATYRGPRLPGFGLLASTSATISSVDDSAP